MLSTIVPVSLRTCAISSTFPFVFILTSLSVAIAPSATAVKVLPPGGRLVKPDPSPVTAVAANVPVIVTPPEAVSSFFELS